MDPSGRRIILRPRKAEEGVLTMGSDYRTQSSPGKEVKIKRARKKK